MTKRFMQAISCALATVVLFSCQKDVSGKEEKVDGVNSKMEKSQGKLKTKTHYGHPVQLGGGNGKTWVTLNAEGVPLSLGVDLSAKAILNQGEEGANYVFELPKKAAVAPYDHLEVGWNPHGHEPAGVYNLPHFDLHLYMISSAYQATIPFLAPPASDVALPGIYKAPAYVQVPGLVPNMGAHLVDVQSPEFNGGTFTKTFIYGSYSGKLIFIEPMFTVSYLNSLVGANATAIPIRQPSAFQKAGYYPTSYTISYDKRSKDFTISFNNLTYRPAG